MGPFRPKIRKASLSVYTVFAVFFLAALSSVQTAYGGSNLEEASELWPQKVATRTPLIGKLHGNTLGRGSEGVFLRIESGEVMVDFGHNGIFKLPVKDTDFLDRVRQAIGVRTFESQGLFTFRYASSFFWPETSTSCRIPELESFDYFVVIYFDYDEASEEMHLVKELSKEFSTLMADDLKTSLILMPVRGVSNAVDMRLYYFDGFHAPTISPYMKKGTVHTLQHDFENKGDLVVIDKNGHILTQNFLSKLKTPEASYELIHDSVAQRRTW